MVCCYKYKKYGGKTISDYTTIKNYFVILLFDYKCQTETGINKAT